MQTLQFERLSEEDKLGNLGKKSSIFKSNFVELLYVFKNSSKSQQGMFISLPFYYGMK